MEGFIKRAASRIAEDDCERNVEYRSPCILHYIPLLRSKIALNVRALTRCPTNLATRISSEKLEGENSLPRSRTVLSEKKENKRKEKKKKENVALFKKSYGSKTTRFLIRLGSIHR